MEEMKMKLKLKQLIILATTLIMILALGGCNNNDTSDTKSTPAQTSSETITENVPDETSTPETTEEVTETPDSTEINVDITKENTTKDGKDCISQVAKIDLDGDGMAEQITAYFIYEGIDNGRGLDTCEIIITNSDGEAYTFSWHSENIKPQLNFAEFDTNDDLIQFFLKSNGPSADPSVQIFSFDGSKIVKNAGFAGEITSYDGLGKIYSFEKYNVNCYYDLNNGLTPLPKENIIGTEIQRDCNILLFKDPGNYNYTSAILSNEYEKDLTFYTENEGFICMVPANTPLTVLDIEFLPMSNDADTLYPVPYIKVRTPDGTEGWFCIVYGD